MFLIVWINHIFVAFHLTGVRNARSPEVDGGLMGVAEI